MIAYVIKDRTKLIATVGDEEKSLASKVILPHHAHARHVPTLLHMGAVETAVQVIGHDATGTMHGVFVPIPEIARALFEVGLVVEPLVRRPKEAPAADGGSSPPAAAADEPEPAPAESERPKTQAKDTRR